MNRLFLNSVKVDFLLDLHPKYIMEWLLQYRIVTEEEGEDILSLGSSEEQVEKLFEILSSKGPEEIEKFIKVLNFEDSHGVNYPWLAKKLAETSFETKRPLNASVKKLLTDGGVPLEANCLVLREDKINTIKENLREASNRESYNTAWIVLHGMSGTGKSVLAAEAVRDNELIDKHFSDGVFWVSLGRKIDMNALGIKMKKLYQKISSDNRTNSAVENLDDLKQNLRRLVVNKHMLIILDDLWEIQSIDVVTCFDIGCPILVTTKFPKAFILFPDCCQIPCTNDWSASESKELLARYVKCDKDELPPETDFICKKCKGSPFTLTQIGRCMAPYKNDVNQWRHLKKKLEKGLKPVMRHRHSSDDELNEMKEIVRLTLNLIEDYKDFFYDFVIFPEDIPVPTRVFTVLWDMEEVEVEQIMLCLRDTSLVQFQFEKDPINSYSYGIHGLYLEVLKEEPSNSIEERHLKLVNNYLKKCKREDGIYDFSLLPDDDYIHYYMAHHISFVNENDIIDRISLDDIYFDLSFVEKKLQKDPKDLRWDYQCPAYEHLFKNKKLLETFISFAGKHAYNIFNNKDCDIIQLGLFESQSSYIHKRAVRMALASNDKSYFEWCNQAKNAFHMQNLNAKVVPFENTRHAAVSADGILVACVGAKETISIFSSASDEELLTLNGHSGAINHCVFNSNRTKLVTASKDKTVRIFEVNLPFTSVYVTRELSRKLKFCNMKPAKKRASVISMDADVPKTPTLVTFIEHRSSVLCCCYSHDEDLIVSSDNIGKALVWQSSTANLKCSVCHSSRNNPFVVVPVIICCFNSDSTLFGTAAYDSIKLWCTNTSQELKEFFKEDMVVKGFCFSRDHVITVADNMVYKYNIDAATSDHFGGSKNFVFTCCSLSPDRQFLACGTSENSVIIYNINSGKVINNLKGHRSNILSVMFTLDGQKLLAVSENGYILYDISHNKDSSWISSEGNLSVQQRDDLLIVSSNYFDAIEVRKGVSGELLCTSESHHSEITACSLSSDCSEVVYGTKDGQVQVLNIQNNNLNNKYITPDVLLPKHSDQINYITHYKSNIFFTCSEDKTVKIWEDRQSPKILKGHQQGVLMCVPFKNSPRLLTCSKDGTLRVWDISSRKMLLKTEGHGNQDIRFCDISFDEQLLASASADGTVKLWNALNGERNHILECNNEVRCCRFSPSFQILISGCDNGEVRLWTLGKKPTSELLCQHSSCVYNIYFSKNGSQFLSIADDIKMWHIGQRGWTGPQTLLLPTSLMGDALPYIWADERFDVFVVILNAVLYVLKRMDNNVLKKNGK